MIANRTNLIASKIGHTFIVDFDPFSKKNLAKAKHTSHFFQEDSYDSFQVIGGAIISLTRGILKGNFDLDTKSISQIKNRNTLNMLYCRCQMKQTNSAISNYV
jgi:hypothetical protein